MADMLGPYPLDSVQHEDCLEGLKKLPDNSVDLVLTDPPYGTTKLSWDCYFDLELFWKEVLRVAKPSCAIIIFCKQPFTSRLLLSQESLFRYELIWEKTRASNNYLIKKQPMQVHENILVFYKEQPTYNDLMYEIPDIYVDKRKAINDSEYTKGHYSGVMRRKKDEGMRHPFSILPFNSEWKKGMHPTQKPVNLCSWIIESYTNKGALVLDPFLGSGTTAVAARQLGRRFLGFEISEEYVEIANKRLSQQSLGSFKKKEVRE